MCTFNLVDYQFVSMVEHEGENKMGSIYFQDGRIRLVHFAGPAIEWYGKENIHRCLMLKSEYCAIYDCFQRKNSDVTYAQLCGKLRTGNFQDIVSELSGVANYHRFKFNKHHSFLLAEILKRENKIYPHLSQGYPVENSVFKTEPKRFIIKDIESVVKNNNNILIFFNQLYSAYLRKVSEKKIGEASELKTQLMALVEGIYKVNQELVEVLNGYQITNVLSPDFVKESFLSRIQS